MPYTEWLINNNRNELLIVLEASKSKTSTWADLVSGESWLNALSMFLLTCVFTWYKEWTTPWYKQWTSSTGHLSYSWGLGLRNLVTFLKPHLLMLSPWGLGCQCMDLKDTNSPLPLETLFMQGCGWELGLYEVHIRQSGKPLVPQLRGLCTTREM